MEEIMKLDTVAEYNSLRGLKTMHPLVTVLDLSKAKSLPARTFNFGLYAVYLKQLNCGEINTDGGTTITMREHLCLLLRDK